MALHLPPLKNISDEVRPLGGSSDRIAGTLVPSGAQVRKFYLGTYSSMPGPVISASEFVPRSLVEHLMRNKKDVALAVKFVQSAHPPDAVTNMEGVMHTFVTPIVPIKMHGDYAYRGRHSVEPFADTQTKHQKARDVVLSALVQPDFEGYKVMLELAGLRSTPTLGRPLPADIHIPSVEAKQDFGQRTEYDTRLCLHMIYHLVSSHRLPAAGSSSLSPVKEADAYDLLHRVTSGSLPASAVQNVFVKVDRPSVPLLSLEILFMTAYHQLRNELSALERLCAHQGYVYTSDPPSIFAQILGSAKLLVRCQAAALRALLDSSPTTLSAMRAFAFNNYADQGALLLFKEALATKAPHVAVVSKSSLFKGGSNGRRYTPTHEGMRGALLVLHNNSDAFGQNVETEGSSSLDGAIGCASSAAASLHRCHPHLLDHVV
ncbi:hypothetical protein EXIGLDRAFT_732164 [Exidia glandulosa HHB12029]|uniref:Uncharacterized protein n=1 Tax=Exidia glandulosa HHB12029 TaxID=1314781 RepID=A0A165KTF6_EXIGL|nr:hypothetical protein EXIGLDRAFT_732164 [Exidia glandulosa HHB12029]